MTAVTDGFTHWQEAFSIADICVKTIAKTLVDGWISRLDVPSSISTDRGAQFESKLFQEVVVLVGTSRIRATAYHPAANGLVERFHRKLKAALEAHNDPNNWSTLLPIVLQLGLRATLKPDLLVYVQTLRLPAEMLATSSQLRHPASRS